MPQGEIGGRDPDPGDRQQPGNPPGPKGLTESEHHCQCRSAAISRSDQMWSATPAAMAGGARVRFFKQP
jgi:hypothetical protein